MKKKKNFKDSEKNKKKPMINSPKWMLSEPEELWNKTNEQQGKGNAPKPKKGYSHRVFTILGKQTKVSHPRKKTLINRKGAEEARTS